METGRRKPRRSCSRSAAKGGTELPGAGRSARRSGLIRETGSQPASLLRLPSEAPRWARVSGILTATTTPEARARIPMMAIDERIQRRVGSYSTLGRTAARRCIDLPMMNTARDRHGTVSEALYLWPIIDAWLPLHS